MCIIQYVYYIICVLYNMCIIKYVYYIICMYRKSHLQGQSMNKNISMEDILFAY